MITINDKKFDFKFGYYELAQFQEERNMSFSQMENFGNEMKLMDIIVIARLGLNAKGANLTDQEVGDMLSEPGAVDQIMEAFSHDMENFMKGQKKAPNKKG